jgi:cytoplasmic iron level regulating protein YaaA (DUF328/UPF0246 family)
VLILLPPSETKRDGGADGSSLDLGLLSFPELTRPRRAVIAATRRLAKNRAAMAAALHLGPTQLFEVARNRELGKSRILPAIERYTGVLFDALDAPGLSAEARAFAGRHVVIHSAMFGLLGAEDPVPAYRLSHDSRLPELSLKKTWRDSISSALSARDELVLDARSEAYVELGPVTRPTAYFLRVVTAGTDGRTRALNHFNKKGKGELVRAIAEAGIDHGSVDSLLDWAADGGIRLGHGAPGELELTV